VEPGLGTEEHSLLFHIVMSMHEFVLAVTFFLTQLVLEILLLALKVTLVCFSNEYSVLLLMYIFSEVVLE
jgi:hypothetical protein